MKGTRKDEPSREGRLREETLQQLFRQAEKRHEPSVEVRDRVFQAVQGEWRQAHRKRRLRWMVPISVAASVLLLVSLAVTRDFGTDADMASGELAKVQRVLGPVERQHADGTVDTVTAGLTVAPGQTLQSAEAAGVALQWHDGSSVRMDRLTRLRILGPGQVELLQGGLYVDTGAADDSVLQIVTPAGMVQHIGTQYMTFVQAASTTVSVRSGTVKLDLADGRMVSGGERLSFDAQGVKTFERVDIHGSSWQWVEALAPEWQAEGRTVAEFLDWVADETGRRVEYASAEARQLAERSRLKGEIQADPVGALELVLPATGLEAQTTDGVIQVSVWLEE